MKTRFSQLSTAVRAEVEARLAWLRDAAGAVTIDGDAHISDLDVLPPEAAAMLRGNENYYHGRPISAEQLIAELDMSGVDAALVWQNPAATTRGADRDVNFNALLAANRYVHDAARRFPRRLIPAGWTDPAGLGLDGALRLVEVCVREFGFAVVKMNPAQNRFPIDSPEVFAVVDRIRALGAVPAFHVGGDTPFTPAAGLAKVARHLAPHRIIAVHMGGGGSGYVEGETLYQEIRTLGLAQPNLFFVQSAKRDTHIESDFIAYQTAGELFARNIAVGSDAPYGRVAWNFGGYRAMFATLTDARHPDPRLRARSELFSPQAVQGYLGSNLARLVAEIYAGWAE
jgi:predicted TIM-barrel fold metal-dependent hydrolase